jgi:hypothetical protein
MQTSIDLTLPEVKNVKLNSKIDRRMVEDQQDMGEKLLGETNNDVD